MKQLRWICFVAMVVAQLAVPYMMISERETTLSEGAAYRFRCGPVDPYDYFRGRYVALFFPDTRLEPWKGAYFTRNQRAYAVLGTDEEGFARIDDVVKSPPASGDYVQVQAYSYRNPNNVLHVNLPFNRYYMNEVDAPEADSVYRSQSRREEGASVLVRVREGSAVIEGLYIDDMPMEEYIRRNSAIEE